ncbi:MAG: hypothetical protein M3046_16785 [Actinomycetota bacterium]|nr:hypothetical protein [Actinomycetota bacterium]
MTARDGFSDDMSRFALDDGAAERLMTGSVDIADAPPPYRPVARALQALRQAPERRELAGEQHAIEQIAAAVMLERQAHSVRLTRRSSSRVAVLATTALVVCALPLTTGLASAGALPEPAQNVASTVLGKVGISVPTGAQNPADNAPPPTTAVPAPPSTTVSSPNAAGSSPGPGGPAPDVAKHPPGTAAPAAPGNGEGDHVGAQSRGTPPNDENSDANKDDAHGGSHAPDRSTEGGDRKGQDR